MNRRSFFGAALAAPMAAKEAVFAGVGSPAPITAAKRYGGGYIGPIGGISRGEYVVSGNAVAKLGINIDSSGIADAHRKLDLFAAAAARCKPLDFLIKHDAKFETGRPDIDCLRSVSPVNKARMAKRG